MPCRKSSFLIGTSFLDEMESGPEGSTLREESKKSSTQTGRCHKTRGFAATSGQDYEVALCCLIFLRALRHARDFFLVSNYAPAGKFDDVVLFFRLKEDQDSRYRAILLQAKHKENTTKRKLTLSKTFHLKDYLESFKNIRKHWQKPITVQDQTIQTREISLVLYSNARCSMGDTAHDVTATPDVKHLSDFLNTGGRLLQISDAQLAGLPEEPETSDFIQRLILCVEQMSVQKFEQILQEEISNVLRLKSLDVAKKLISKLKHMVKEWWKEEEEGRYLTRQSEEWKKVLVMQVTRFNTNTLKVQKQLNLDFAEAGLEKIKSLFGRTQIWVSVTDKYHATATRLRLFKALRSCLVLDAKFIDNQLDEVEALWGTDVCPSLVLDVSGDSPEEHSQVLIKRLQLAVRNHASRNLVVISKEKPKREEWFVLEAEPTWSVLDPSSQDRLLSMQVDLQGKFVALRDVVGLDSSTIMSDELIHSICDPMNGTMKLGVSIPNQLEYYVPRCMQRIYSKEINYDALNKTRTLIFTKCSNDFKLKSLREIKTLSDLKRLNRVRETIFVVEECSDSVVRDLCCRLCVRGINDLGETCPENRIMEFIPNSFICEEKVVVLEGVPGVGKSSFVTAMCSSVKERFPSSWVIRVDIVNHSDFIRGREFTSIGDIKAFLLSDLPTDLERDLVEHSLDVTGNVFIFLDAFDEMSPNFTTKCCALLKNIVTTVKYRQVVVTTRPITSKQVEEALGTEAFHLPVFSRDEQRSFLERFCKTSGKNVNDEEIYDLHHRQGEVLAIPLLCKLAAEVLLNSDDKLLLKFLNPWKKVLMYQLFVKQSINNRLAEKFSLELSKPGMENILKPAINDHLENLQGLAVRKLIPVIHHSSLDISTKLPEDKFGLVVYNGESVDFEHHTFADYFLGCWLARHWQECPKQLLLEIFSYVRFQFALQTMSWFLFEDFPLHKAVAQGDVEAVRQLRSSGTTDRGGRSALHVAAMTEGKQDEVVNLLMTNGEATNGKDHVFDSVAVRFAENILNWEFLEAVLRNGKKLKGLNLIIDPNAAIQALIQITIKDLPSLFQYIIGLHKEMIPNPIDIISSHHIISYHQHHSSTRVEIRELLQHQLHPEFFRSIIIGDTLLHLAAANNSASIVKLITEKHHEVNVMNSDGDTPLHVASTFGCKEAAMVLLDVGADPNINSLHGVTVLMLASYHGHKEFVKLLLERGVDPNIYTERGETALAQAAFRGQLDIAKLLIEKGGNPKIMDKYGISALMMASEQGHVEVVKLLIDSGMDPNTKYVDGKTALIGAATRGQLEVVKLLIEKGADPNLKCYFYPTPVVIIADPSRMGLRRQLIKHGPKLNYINEVTTLMLACNDGQLDVVKLLLEKGVDPNITIEDGRTALWHAAIQGFPEVVKILIEKGADTEVRRKNISTALIAAVDKGHLEVVEVLLDKGGDPNNTTIEGATALMIAAAQGHFDIVNLLIEKGLEPNLTTKSGRTALMIAVDQGHLEVVKLLIEKGADPRIKADDGITALTYARKRGHGEIMKLLINKIREYWI